MKAGPHRNVNMIDRNTGDLDEAQALLFFAFRDLTAEPDRVLAERGLFRVHHRILYFVRRNQGLGPGELTRILGVSKQALARPLRDLIAQGLLASAAVPENRRRRALTLTAAGARLERRLSGSQRRRFAGAFRAAGPEAAAGWRAVMARLGARAPVSTGHAAPPRRRSRRGPTPASRVP
jgi:DNA-binding MarR family transcriptional regulator